MADEGKSKPISYRTPTRATPAPPGAPAALLVERVVSGGQTGVDRAALDFAIERGLAHGGWCPQGRRAEDGEIAAAYELKETPETDYPQRTEWNVRDSDATVIFSISRKLSGGSKLTRQLARRLGKPCLHLSESGDGKLAQRKLIAFLQRHGVRILNVAGPRLSTEPAARAFAMRVLDAVWPKS